MNANFDAVEAALENTLSRDGTSPNQMGAPIDMNSNKIINLAAPTSGSDAARLTDVLTVAPGTNVATFLGTPSSANLAAAVTDETGTGLLVFNTSPTLVTPDLGTPSAVMLTNGTGLPVSGIAASTSAAVGVGSVELGHATDTTLSRASAGNVAIEGNLVYRAGGTDVPVADGGTGASTAGDALTNFGVSAFVQTLLGGANQAAFLAALGQIDSAELDFLQAGTAAIPITAQAKLRKAPVLPEEFGAFTTATITTATLLAAFTAAMADGRPIELSGSYTIDGPITPTTAVEGAELRIVLKDDVTITVDAGAALFNRVFYAESSTATNHSITGAGTLVLDCNNRCAAGFWLRHLEGSGTATAGAATTLTDSSKSWAVNRYAGLTVTINSGTGIGQTRTISSNTATVLTVSTAWTTNPDATSTYSISLGNLGGTVLFNQPVHVKNLTGTATNTTAAGVIVLGQYERVMLRSTTVENVTRSAVAGECSGIAISGFDGEVEMYSPVVRRIYSGPSTADADCIKCFGRQSGATNTRREGSVRIYSPVMENSQVRLYKDQCGDTVIYSPWCRRRGVDGTTGSFAATNSVDFDFQTGNGLVLDARIEYYKSAAGVTPLGSSHSVFAFQHTISDSEMYNCARNTTIISDVIIPRIVASTTNSSAAACTTELDGLTIIPRAGLTTGAIERGLVEFDAASFGLKGTPTTFITRNTRAPSVWPVLAYNGYSALVSGTATAGSSTTLTDSGKAWTVNDQAGRVVRITGGTGIGQTRTIISNTATVLTVAAAWVVTPDATSVYSIWYSFAELNLDTGTATSATATTLVDTAKTWATSGFLGRNVRITSGTGLGQTRRITANTATQLTVAAWSVTPDATSVYAILGPKLTINIDKCSTSMPVAGNQTRAFSSLSGSQIFDPGSFMIGDNPGYRNNYSMHVCPETMQAGTKIVLYLDDTTTYNTKLLDTDLNTPLTGGSAPWGSAGMLFLECKGISNFSVAQHDTIIEARLNSSTVSPSAWFTQNGGVNWMALN